MLLRISLFSIFLAVVLSADCTTPKDAGIACSEGEAKKFFYFDTRTKVCQPLFYKGCGGNENRFESASECREVCLNGGKKVDTPIQPLVLKSGHDQWVHATKCNAEFLIPNGEYEKCASGKCPAHHSCNGDVCCPTKEFVCSLTDDNGNSSDGIQDKPRFGWSDKWNTCVRFSYYGMNGNYNNFPNFNSCQRYCNPKNRN